MSDVFSDNRLKTLADQMGGASQEQSVQPQSQPSMKWPMAAAGLGDLGDIISTRVAMSHGADEANPTVPGKNHPWANTAMLGAQALGTQLLIRALGKNHPTIGKVLGYGTAALGGFNTARNMHNATLWDEYYQTHPNEKR